MPSLLALLALTLTAGCSIESSGLAARNGIDARVTLDAGVGRDADPTRDTGEPTRDSGPPDGDGDGVPASTDCDDTDPTVGRSAERSCRGACGPGLERCTDGSWLSCDAPTDCTCTDGATRTLPCALCGTQSQVCTSGTWLDDGVCTGAGVCSPGELSAEMRSCGRCGTQRRTRTCNASCTWGDFGPWSGCSGEGACAAGDTERRDVTCGACDNGTRAEIRTCDATCSWGPFSAASGCMNETTCAGGDGTVCPGENGIVRDCRHSHMARVCTCTTGGDWVLCGECRGGL